MVTWNNFIFEVHDADSIHVHAELWFLVHKKTVCACLLYDFYDMYLL